MKWIIFNDDTINQYIQFIDSHPNSGIWHHSCWLDFQLRSKRAKEGFFFGIEVNSKLRFTGLLLIYQTTLNFNYAYIPAGFLYKDITNDIYDFFLSNLADIAISKKIVFTKIDSITPFSKNFNKLIFSKKSHNFKVKSPIPTYTNILDLHQSEDDLLKQMRSKGRYNIKLSIKKGVTVRQGTKEEISGFYKLLSLTADRDGFILNSEDYYAKMVECIPNAVLLMAYHDDLLIASGIFTYTKNQGLYYYGASSNVKRNLMASYLIQWKAILIAKERKCKFFDFMGIAPPDNKKHNLAGVTDFKLKFGGKVIRFNPSFHIIHNHFVYFFYKLAKKMP